MRLSVVILLFIATAAHAASRPHQCKPINYAPRGHPCFRMLHDWFSNDAATGLEVRTMADADLEIIGLRLPHRALSARRQWDALDEFIRMAEKHNTWVLPHRVDHRAVTVTKG